MEKGGERTLSSRQNQQIRQKERGDLPMFDLGDVLLRLVSEAKGTHEIEERVAEAVFEFGSTLMQFAKRIGEFGEESPEQERDLPDIPMGKQDRFMKVFLSMKADHGCA